MTSHSILNTFRYFKIPLQGLQDLTPGSLSVLIPSLSPLSYSLYLLDILAFCLILNMPKDDHWRGLSSNQGSDNNSG